MKEAINAILVDDEAGLRSYLKTLLNNAHPEVRIVGEAENILEAAQLIDAFHPDLVFLDIEMPGGNGFELLKNLKTWDFELIFTTGHREYAIQAIRFSALDYLPKPVHPDELQEAMERFHTKTKDRFLQNQIAAHFLSNIREEKVSSFKLSLSQGDRCFFLAPKELSHCVADRNYTEVFAKDGRRFLMAKNLGVMEEMLIPHDFIRVNRSALVNRFEISHIQGSDVVMKDGQQLEISRRRMKEVKEKLR